MERPAVFVTRRLFPEALEPLGRETTMTVWDGDLPPPQEVLLERARGCEGLLTQVTDRIDAALLDAAPRLRVISQMAVGYDNIDVAECTRRGVLVGYTPGVLTTTTAELAFALLLAAARRVVEGDRDVHQGKWKTFEPLGWLGQDLSGSTLGVIGLGRIGLEVAKRARAFEMTVLYYDAQRRPQEEERYGFQPVDLPTLLRSSDFITIHTPLTPETRHLIGARELRMMKPTAILVNTARGPIVDGRALYEALRDGVIAGAALDVTEVEPIPPDDPLLTLPNCIITPHIGSATVRTRRRMADLAVQNLLAGLKGEPMPHCLNPEARTGGRPPA